MSLVVTDEADAQLLCGDLRRVAVQGLLGGRRRVAESYCDTKKGGLLLPRAVGLHVDAVARQVLRRLPDYDSPVPSDCYDCISGCLHDKHRGRISTAALKTRNVRRKRRRCAWIVTGNHGGHGIRNTASATRGAPRRDAHWGSASRGGGRGGAAFFPD